MVCIRFSALPCIGCVEVPPFSFLRVSGWVCKKAGPYRDSAQRVCWCMCLG